MPQKNLPDANPTLKEQISSMTTQVTTTSHSTKPSAIPAPLEISHNFAPSPQTTTDTPIATHNEEESMNHATTVTTSPSTSPTPLEAMRVNKNLSKLYSDSKTIVFIDESYEKDKNGIFHYVLGFVSIDSNHLESLRKEADEAFKGWYHANGKDCNNEFIGLSNKLSENQKMATLIQRALKDGKVRIGATTYTAPQIGSKRQKKAFERKAREACIKKLVELLKDEPASALIFEEVKGHSLKNKNKCACDNCLDKALLKRLNHGQTSRNKIRHTHISPEYEHLLWLPDAIAHLTFRYRARRTSDDVTLYKLFGEFCHTYETNQLEGSQ